VRALAAVARLGLFGLILAVLAPPSALAQEAPSPVPHPRPEQMSAGVREEVAAARQRLEAALAAAATPAPELATAWGELAELYHTYLFPEAADRCYQEARKLAPKVLRWAYLEAILAQQQRDLAGATALFEEVLTLSAAYVPALLRLGAVELAGQNLDRAAELYGQVLARAPDSAAAHAGLARVARARGDLAAAVTHFRRALEIQPQADLLHYQLGLVLRDLGDGDAARAELALAGRRAEVFSDPLAEKLVPESVGSLLGRGGRALARGDREGAIAAFRAALEEAPENLTARENLASVLLGQGEVEEALTLYREALQLSPERPVAHLNLAKALLASGGDRSEAIELLGKALDLAPDYGQAHGVLGEVLLSQERFAEAEGHFAQAIAAAPGNGEAHLGRGRTLARLGRLTEARGELETAADLLGTDGGGGAALLLDLATLREQTGDPEGALAALDQVAHSASEPFTRALALFNMGNLRLAGGQIEEAVGHYRQAVEIEPAFQDAHFNLASALSRLGRGEEALASFRRVRELAPEDEGGYAGQLTVLAGLGRYREARQVLAEGLARIPASTPLRLALARLLAASPEADLRDPARALALAEEIFRAGATPLSAEALAMALAASGRFEEARALQEQVVTAAREGGAPPDLLRGLEENLRRYGEGTAAVYRP